MASIKAMEKLNSQLTRPKPFPLERLLAIFYNIVEEEVNPTATINSQVTGLVMSAWTSSTQSQCRRSTIRHRSLR